MSINQFEPSARTAEVQRNAIGNADLDDALIGQALSIFQGSRQSKMADTALLHPSGDQAMPPVVRNQIDPITGILNSRSEQAQTVRNSGKCDVVNGNSLGETISRLINGTSEQLPVVRRNDKGDRANLPSTGDLLRGIIEGPHNQAIPRINNDKCDRAIIPDAPVSGTRGRPNGEPTSSIGRGLQNLFESLDPDALPKRLEDNPRGIFACTAEVPNTLKDALRRLQNELHGPDSYFLCVYRNPPEGNHSIREWQNPNGPSDMILCSAKTPITGQKPGPDNYYSCVYYYPLKMKDGAIQIQRQSD